MTQSPASAAVPPDGTYRLINDRSGRCLDQEWSVGSNHRKVLAWPCADGSTNQLWRKLGGVADFTLINVRSGWCINQDQDYSGNTPHSNVLAWPCKTGAELGNNRPNNQLWVFIGVA